MAISPVPAGATASVRVRQVSAPENSLVTELASAAHYEDTFVLRLPPGTFTDVDALAHACTKFPAWVNQLMRLRNALVAPFGLKTGKGLPPAAIPARFSAGDRAGIFRVLARSAEELLLGEDDRHLDFRFSLLLRESEACQEVFATTTVHFHNVWGRLYFLFVAPVHRLIIPAMLRNAVGASVAA